MTAEELIAEARANREQNPPLNLEGVQSVLYMILQHILQTTDCEEEPNATSARVARLLAMMLATLEDQKRH